MTGYHKGCLVYAGPKRSALLTCYQSLQLVCCCTCAEDVALIESLEESKRVATEISEKVVEARETEGAINESRNRYRPVAERGAMLFFLLNSLNKIHAFYQYSLNAFVMVFSRGLDLAPDGPKKNEHVTLRQLQKRLSGNAGDFDEVIKKAKRQSSNAGGKRSKRTTAQSGHMGPGVC
jgi:dynein heavy chain